MISLADSQHLKTNLVSSTTGYNKLLEKMRNGEFGGNTVNSAETSKCTLTEILLDDTGNTRFPLHKSKFTRHFQAEYMFSLSFICTVLN